MSLCFNVFSQANDLCSYFQDRIFHLWTSKKTDLSGNISFRICGIAAVSQLQNEIRYKILLFMIQFTTRYEYFEDSERLPLKKVRFFQKYVYVHSWTSSCHFIYSWKSPTLVIGNTMQGKILEWRNGITHIHHTL